MSQQKNSAELLVKILLPVSIIQLAIITFLLMKLNESNNKIDQLTVTAESKDAEVTAKAKELESLTLDLERIRQEREKLGLDNDELNREISELNAYVSELKKSKKLDDKKRKELETLVAKLRSEITQKDREIAALKNENDSLKTDVSNLTSEKNKLGDSLQNVASKKKDLADKLAKAAILRATQVKITMLKSNGKESEDDEYKASKIDKMKIVFTIADNRAAEQNEKEVYMRLKTPNGEVFSDPSNGGGTFTLADGTPINYTQKQSFNFDNSGQTLTFVTLGGLKYIVGVYVVEFFCEGYKIGEGTFKVK